MHTFEKFYSLLAIACAIAIVGAMIFLPDLRQLDRLLPISLIGLAVNIGLMYIVLKDIFLRPFSNQSTKFLWLGLVLLLWPSIIFYLFRYGFKPRTDQE